jgi:hypothetical protein
MPILAYLDPGTGGLIVQAVLGGVAGVTVAARAYGRRFVRRKGTAEPQPVEPEASVPVPSEPDPA